jgi:CDP-6-deoxy-D-xylo-4-hexulose-3-dehydrase
MEKKQQIDEFIKSLTEKYGIIPKFAHNNKTFDKKVFYSGPFFDNEEISAIMETLIFGKWFSSGENVYKFENEFSKKFDLGHSLMVNSGSSANLVMIAALKKYFGWKDGDEIILSAVGFPTTLSPIILNGLKPVFADIEMDTLNFDIDEVELNITVNTRAIIISPVLANPPDIDALLEMKDRYGIELILDNCDSLGSMWRDKFLTEYAVASSCSFYPAHHITTGEGGMVSSHIKEVIDIARSISWWGRDCHCIGMANLLPNGTCGNRFDCWLKPMYDGIVDHKYVFTNLGYNLKPLDIQGAMGNVQLKKFNKIHDLRRDHKERIEKIFLKIDGVKGVKVHSEAIVSWFGVPIICETNELKDNLVKHLESNGIQTRNYFAGNILIHPAYKEYGNWEEYPYSNEVLRKVFFVGCSPHYTNEVINYINEVVEDFIT